MRAFAALLFAVTLVAFLPVLGGGFLQWDDQFYVEQNPAIRDPAGLARIWDPTARAPDRHYQYYPLTSTSYWLEYRLWGLDARGYHATNLALHLVDTGLVLLLAAELGASPPVQAAVAAVFALHPTQVASVAWIAERKNTLSGFFYLGAFLLYLRHRRGRRWGPYAASLVAFAAALLSKTQTVTLPISVALAEWCLQRDGRLERLPARRIAARLVPMCALGALAALVTLRFEDHWWTRSFTPTEHLLIAANTAAFYVGTFVAPLRLSPVYPEWHVATADLRWWVPLGAWLGVLALGVRMRRKVPPLVAFGAGQFFVALAPVLGFVSFDLQTFTFVADHFLYLATIGGALALGVLIERAIGQGTAAVRRRAAVAAVAGLLCVAGAAQTARESGYWRTNETFWTRVHERDPDGFLAIYNLGNHYARLGRWAAALPFYERAAAIRPDVDYPFRRLVEALRNSRGPDAALAACNAKLGRTPRFAAAYVERARIYELLGRDAEAARDHAEAQRLAPHA